MRRTRIFRQRPGMWVIVAPNYATFSASTWRKAMDFVSPPPPPTVAQLTEGIRQADEALCAAIRRAEDPLV